MTADRSTGRTTARSQQAAETRQRLIDAAVKCFSENNYEDVAVGDIAKSIGVAHGLLFHYFGNKRGIYLAALRSAALDLEASYEMAAAELPAGQHVRAIFTAHLRYLASHPSLGLRLVLGGRATDPEAWSVFEADRWHAIDRVATILGLDPSVRPLRMMLRSAAGAVDEATVHWLQHDKPFAIEKMVEAFVDMTAAGLRATTRLDARVKVDRAIELLAEGAPNKTTRRRIR